MNSLWIGPRGRGKTKNLHFRARHLFELDRVPSAPSLKIAAESFYKVWLNGRLLGAGPARGSRTLNFFDSYEVAEFLRPGRNVLCVLVQCMNIPTFVSCPARGSFSAEIEGVLSTGRGSWLLKDAPEEWPSDVPLFCMQVGLMEWRDLRREPKGWLELDYDASKWDAPELFQDGVPGKRLLPRPVPPLALRSYIPKSIATLAATGPLAAPQDREIASLMSSETHHPPPDGLLPALVDLCLGGQRAVAIQPPGDGRGVTMTFDFGRETIGFFKAELDAPAGAIADVAYDEALEDGRLRSSRKDGLYKMADRYILEDGANEVGTTLQERGFRFVELSLRNFSRPIVIKGVRAVDRRYPVSGRGSFHCSDPLLNRIWDICFETLSTCATDVFNDCPWRERAFWVNDLLVENLSWLQSVGDSRMNAHALRLALSNVREDGWLPGVCPDSGNPRATLVAANLFIPLILRDYLLYSGDLALIRELLPASLKLIELFAPLRSSDGLIAAPGKYWNFLDWSYELDGVSLDGKKSSLLEWIYCLSLDSAAWLSERLGDSPKAEALRSGIPDAAKNALTRFWPDSSKFCADWLEDDGAPSKASSQLTHALALLSGRLPDSKRETALSAIDSASIRVPELYLHHFVFRAMEDAGMDDAALARIRLHWGKIAKSGATTLWESAIYQPRKAFHGGVGSLCHAFGTAPIGVFQRVLLGVRPLAPGFKRFALSPSACGLEMASGSIPTPSGDIRVSWRIDIDGMRVSIEIPQGLEARLPDGSRLGAGAHKIILRGEA